MKVLLGDLLRKYYWLVRRFIAALVIVVIATGYLFFSHHQHQESVCDSVVLIQPIDVYMAPVDCDGQLVSSATVKAWNKLEQTERRELLKQCGK